MLTREINAISSQNYLKTLCPLCGENTKFLMLKTILVRTVTTVF